MKHADPTVPLSLATICGGQLEEEFQRLYLSLLASLGDKEKGTITATIEIKRIPETQTMVNVAYKLASKFPNRAKASICQVDAEGLLKTAEAQKPKVVQLTLNAGGKDNNDQPE